MSTQAVRISALTTTLSQFKDQVGILQQKSRLDDQLIQDMRQHLFGSKHQNMQIEFKDELNELKVQKAVLE